MKVDELLMHTMIWVNLKHIRLYKKEQTQKRTFIITVIWNSRADMVVWSWGGRNGLEMGTGQPSGVLKIALVCVGVTGYKLVKNTPLYINYNSIRK